MDDYDDGDDGNKIVTVGLDIVKMKSTTSQCDSDNDEHVFVINKNGKLQPTTTTSKNEKILRNESDNEDYSPDAELPITNVTNTVVDGESSSTENPQQIDKPENIIKCSICPQLFPAKSFLVEHIKSHFKTMSCEFCQKTFVGDMKLNYHIKTVHLKKTIKSTIKFNFPCVICNEKFLTKSKLQQHTVEKHESLTSPATCPYCFGQFFDRNCLHEHIKLVHSNETENPVACDVCGRICRNQKAVDRHRLTHFIETKEFICDFCQNGFTRKTNLAFHMRIHTGERPFKCKECPKSFSHVSGLNCHERVHTGERPYKCPFCDKCFIHSTDLRRHRRSHGNEEKRFACSLCSAKFYEQKFLKVHYSTHSKNELKRLMATNIPKDLAANSTVTIQMEVQKQIKTKKGKSQWK